ADMGILLTFMFLWNMLGALALIPALSHFLLKDVHAHGASVVLPQVCENTAPAETDTRTVQCV
ncbi:MAG: hypothetical protein ACRESP_14185, partial [Pseudomonas sp.]